MSNMSSVIVQYVQAPEQIEFPMGEFASKAMCSSFTTMQWKFASEQDLSLCTRSVKVQVGHKMFHLENVSQSAGKGHWTQ